MTSSRQILGRADFGLNKFFPLKKSHFGSKRGIFGHFRSFWDDCGRCGYLGHLRWFWDHFRPFSTDFGRFWTHFDLFGLILTNFGPFLDPFWSILADFGWFWLILDLFGPILVDFDFFDRFWSDFDCHLAPKSAILHLKVPFWNQKVPILHLKVPSWDLKMSFCP